MKKLIAAALTAVLVLAPCGAAFGEMPVYGYANGILQDWTANRSDWSDAELTESVDIGIVPETMRNKNWTKPITRGEFAALCVTVFEKKTGLTLEDPGSTAFADIANDPNAAFIRKAFAKGFTTGTSATTFEPAALITREDLITMLTRAYKAFRWPDWTPERNDLYRLSWLGDDRYYDDGQISDYAWDGIYYFSKFGVLIGTGYNHISPKLTASREEAIVMAYRMYVNF